VNEEALVHWGLSRQKQTNSLQLRLTPVTNLLIRLVNVSIKPWQRGSKDARFNFSTTTAVPLAEDGHSARYKHVTECAMLFKFQGVYSAKCVRMLIN
jgi:hypothetical protein